MLSVCCFRERLAVLWGEVALGVVMEAALLSLVDAIKVAAS